MSPALAGRMGGQTFNFPHCLCVLCEPRVRYLFRGSYAYF